MRTRYDASPWIHEFPRSRRPEFPRFRGDEAADVVIVGGGLTGCATAHACAAAGLRPVLLERDRLGHGSAGHGAGLLSPEPGPLFRDLAAAHGVKAARRVFEAWRGGARDGAALLRRLGVRCALEGVDLVVLAASEQAKAFGREHAARVAAGLDASWLSQKRLGSTTRIEGGAAFLVRDGFSLDPYRACVGLAIAASKKRARIFERSPVARIRMGKKGVEIGVGGGTLHAATVIVATGTPGDLFKPLRRHFHRREAYLALTEPLPAAMRRQLGDPAVALQDTRVPPRRLHWTAGHRLVLSGGDQPEMPARTRDAVLVQRTGQLMYDLLTTYPAISGLRPEYGWSAPYGQTADGLMYIGAHRNYPHHLFALGGSPHSATGAFVSARLLLRALQGRSDRADMVFGWTR